VKQSLDSLYVFKRRLNDSLALYNNLPPEWESIEVWSADLADDEEYPAIANGSIVSLIDIYSFDKRKYERWISPSTYGRNPAYQETAGVNKSSLSSSPYGFIFNMNMLGPQMAWSPQYRLATITAIDEDTETATLSYFELKDLDGVIYNGNEPTTGIKFDYMQYGYSSFSVGDAVIVSFCFEKFDSPLIVGFYSNPVGAGLNGLAAQSYTKTDDNYNFRFIGNGTSRIGDNEEISINGGGALNPLTTSGFVSSKTTINPINNKVCTTLTSRTDDYLLARNTTPTDSDQNNVHGMGDFQGRTRILVDGVLSIHPAAEVGYDYYVSGVAVISNNGEDVYSYLPINSGGYVSVGFYKNSNLVYSYTPSSLLGAFYIHNIWVSQDDDRECIVTFKGQEIIPVGEGGNSILKRRISIVYHFIFNGTNYSVSEIANGHTVFIGFRDLETNALVITSISGDKIVGDNGKTYSTTLGLPYFPSSDYGRYQTMPYPLGMTADCLMFVSGDKGLEDESYNMSVRNPKTDLIISQLHESTVNSEMFFQESIINSSCIYDKELGLFNFAITTCSDIDYNIWPYPVTRIKTTVNNKIADEHGNGNGVPSVLDNAFFWYSSKETVIHKITNIKLTSNNTNPSYAKSGDTITITFTQTYELETLTLNIAGQSITPNKQGDNYTANYTVTGTTPEIPIQFSIIADGDEFTDTSGIGRCSRVIVDLTKPTTTITHEHKKPRPIYNSLGEIDGYIYDLHVAIKISESTNKLLITDLLITDGKLLRFFNDRGTYRCKIKTQTLDGTVYLQINQGKLKDKAGNENLLITYEATV